VKNQLLVKTQVDIDGRLIIPAELASRFGFTPGADVYIEEGNNEIRMLRPVSNLPTCATWIARPACEMCGGNHLA
jgi:bifunctional DNA-binding transcriptional regulator/antitoxin component of YhaV-PrlF toxin-antitoxin module